MTDNDQLRLVVNYIGTVQRARADGDASDWAAVRRFLAHDVVIKMAGPWTDQPWRVVATGRDALIERLQAPINKASSLTTETVNAQCIGNEVMVEQLSTLADANGTRSSMVCHIFSVSEGVITGVRAYRNDLGLPAG